MGRRNLFAGRLNGSKAAQVKLISSTTLFTARHSTTLSPFLASRVVFFHFAATDNLRQFFNFSANFYRVDPFTFACCKDDPCCRQMLSNGVNSISSLQYWVPPKR
jgi:hypothetical protein